MGNLDGGVMGNGGDSNFVSLGCSGGVLEFKRVDLTYSIPASSVPIWALKNNKTVRETLAHPKYSKLAGLCSGHSSGLDQPLGAFLFDLLKRGDELYKRFLNEDGMAVFSTFQLSDASVVSLRGLYLYRLQSEIVYIGRCLDSYGKRINQGYGKIHPKNCYLDGQRTNCRLNALVSSNQDQVRLFLCPIQDEETISRLESELLKIHRPRWNKQLS